LRNGDGRVLNHGMTVVHSLDLHRRHPGGSGRLMAIYHRAAAIEGLRSSAGSSIPRRIPHRYRVDLSVRGGSNALDGYSSINDGRVTNGIIVNDGRAIVNIPDFG